MAPDEGVSKPAGKLPYTAAVQLLDRLSVTEKSNGNAIALRAEALRALCRFSDALPYFQQAVTDNPKSMTSWLGLDGA